MGWRNILGYSLSLFMLVVLMFNNCRYCQVHRWPISKVLAPVCVKVAVSHDLTTWVRCDKCACCGHLLANKKKGLHRSSKAVWPEPAKWKWFIAPGRLLKVLPTQLIMFYSCNCCDYIYWIISKCSPGWEALRKGAHLSAFKVKGFNTRTTSCESFITSNVHYGGNAGKQLPEHLGAEEGKRITVKWLC